MLSLYKEDSSKDQASMRLVTNILKMLTPVAMRGILFDFMSTKVEKRRFPAWHKFPNSEAAQQDHYNAPFMITNYDPAYGEAPNFKPHIDPDIVTFTWKQKAPLNDRTLTNMHPNAVKFLGKLQFEAARKLVPNDKPFKKWISEWVNRTASKDKVVLDLAKRFNQDRMSDSEKSALERATSDYYREQWEKNSHTLFVTMSSEGKSFTEVHAATVKLQKESPKAASLALNTTINAGRVKKLVGSYRGRLESDMTRELLASVLKSLYPKPESVTEDDYKNKLRHYFTEQETASVAGLIQHLRQLTPENWRENYFSIFDENEETIDSHRTASNSERFENLTTEAYLKLLSEVSGEDCWTEQFNRYLGEILAEGSEFSLWATHVKDKQVVTLWNVLISPEVSKTSLAHTTLGAGTENDTARQELAIKKEILWNALQHPKPRSKNKPAADKIPAAAAPAPALFQPIKPTTTTADKTPNQGSGHTHKSKKR